MTLRALRAFVVNLCLFENAQKSPVLNFSGHPTTYPPKRGCAKMQGNYGILQGGCGGAVNKALRAQSVGLNKSEIGSQKSAMSYLSTKSMAGRFPTLNLKGYAV